MANFYAPETDTGTADSVRRQKERARNTVESNINQVSAYIQTGDFDDSLFYSQTCMKLGSNIDSAIAMNEAPSSSHMLQLLLIVKEIYRHKTELLLPSLMLLMLPIKAACQIGWFPDKDKDDLLMLAKEVSYGFSNTDKMSIESNHADFYVSNIISRFYPKMKVENILTSFDIKAGYGCFVADFHISMGMLPRHCQNLWILVARIDNMDTAACIASPSDVDFLINGTGVPRRTKRDMGKGPQLPSNVTKMVKYGVNLIHVLGDFDGPYIIAVAFMNLITSPDPPQLQDYVNPMSDEVDSDCNVIGMSSRISLNCPISQRRIGTPVKGHLCNHPQCFDYKYFMEINSRRPTWKCPLCNMPVCNLDIRIDQNFLKILNEVGGYVRDVIISADGSWTAVMPDTGQATATNTNPMSQNNHVPDTAGNLISVKANDTLPNYASALHSSGSTAISVGAERPFTLQQSPVTKAAVSPPQVQPFRDSCLQPQGSCSMIGTPPSVQPPMHHDHINPVNLTAAQPLRSLTNPNHPFSHSRSQQVETDRPTQANVGTSTTEQVQNTALFTPVQLTQSVSSSPHSVALAFEQLRRGGEQQHYTTPGLSQADIGRAEQPQSTTMFTPVQLAPSVTGSPHIALGFEQLRKGDEQQHHTTPGQSQADVGTTEQAQSTTLFTHPIALAFEHLRRGGEQRSPAPNVRPLSPSPLPEPSGDAMPFGRMRGSLRGEQLAAARLQFLTPPQQSIRANEPWSRPTPSNPRTVLMRQPPTNSKNTLNGSSSGNLPQ